MNELTHKELHNIFSWLPYREDWPIDRNQREDNILSYYGALINYFTKNPLFDAYYSEDGGYGNYLEFICYPPGQLEYDGDAIMVCISLCAPIAAYGQIHFWLMPTGPAWGFIHAETTGIITNPLLKKIEDEIIALLQSHQLKILDAAFVSQDLTQEVADHLQGENHNEGNQYLHGLFQKND